MPSRTSLEAEETLIPLGVVFLTVGFIILMTVLLLWVLTPRTTIAHTSQSILPEQQQHVGSALKPAPTDSPAIITPGLTSAAETAILLPGTPLDASQPSSYSGRISSGAGGDNSLHSEPVRIVIPVLELDAPVVPVGLEESSQGNQRYLQWQVPRGYAIGWHQTSAGLGQSGNTVLNGHNNIYGHVFRDLIDLTVGERFTVYDANRPYTYEVTQQEILRERGQPLSVRQKNARWIEPTDDERLTIVSCWPYTTNSHRLVVVAKPVELARER